MSLLNSNKKIKSKRQLLRLVFLLSLSIVIARFFYNMSKSDEMDLVLPKKSEKSEILNETRIVVRLKSEEHYYINDNEVAFDSIEKELVALLEKTDNPIIILESDNNIRFDKAVFIMDIANRNKVKLIMAVAPK